MFEFAFDGVGQGRCGGAYGGFAKVGDGAHAIEAARFGDGFFSHVICFLALGLIWVENREAVGILKDNWGIGN